MTDSANVVERISSDEDDAEVVMAAASMVLEAEIGVIEVDEAEMIAAEEPTGVVVPEAAASHTAGPGIV